MGEEAFVAGIGPLALAFRREERGGEVITDRRPLPTYRAARWAHEEHLSEPVGLVLVYEPKMSLSSESRARLSAVPNLTSEGYGRADWKAVGEVWVLSERVELRRVMEAVARGDRSGLPVSEVRQVVAWETEERR